jgi:tetratricopeptide (TPR) repeat protein
MPKGTGLAASVAEWGGLFRNHFYQLAAFEARRMTEQPRASGLAWFLLGQSQLALNQHEQARESFEKARDLGNSGLGGPDWLRGLADNLQQSAGAVLALMEREKRPSPPPDPFVWLEDPSTVGRVTLGSLGALGLARTGIAHVPGSLVDRIDIFPDRERVLGQLAAAMVGASPGMVPGLSPPAPTLARQWPETVAAPPAPPPPPPAERPSLGPPRLAPSPTAARPTATPPMAPPVAPPMAAPAAQPTRPAVAMNTPARVVAEASRLAQAGRQREAIALVADAIRSGQQDPELVELQARLHEELGEVSEAARVLAAGAAMARHSGARQRAEQLADRALQLARMDSRLLWGIATVLMAAGLSGHATRALKQAANLLRVAHDNEGLRQVLTELLKVEPDEDTRRELQSLGRPAVAAAATGAPGLTLPPATMPPRTEPEQRGPVRVLSERTVGAEDPDPTAPERDAAQQALLGAFGKVFIMTIVAMVFGFSGIGVAPLIMGALSKKVIEAAKPHARFNPVAPLVFRAARGLIILATILGFLLPPYPF